MPRHTGLASGIFALVATVYAATLCPSVYVEGSGELIGATWWPGTPHPTGYPLYVLLVRTLSWALPVTSPARAVNAATAAIGALAAVVMFLLLRGRGCHPAAAAAASLWLAGGRTFWSQAVIAEVYTLFVLLSLLTLTVALWARRGPDRRRRVLLAGYVGGLAATSHLQAVLLVPAALAAAVWPAPGGDRVGDVARRAAWAAVGMAAGSSPILYLVIRNGLGPGFHWGLLDTLPALWDHVSGALYRPSFQWLPLPVLQAAAVRFGLQLTREWPVPALAVIAWGVVVAWRRDRALAGILGTAAAANVASALIYHRDPSGLDVFFLLTLLAACVWAGFGLDDLWHRLRHRLGGGVATALIAVAAAAPAVNYRAADRSASWLPDRYGRTLLAQLPPGAVLLTDGDSASYLLDYLHRIEGVRPDVDIYNRMGRGTDLALGAASAERAAVRRQREARLLGGSRPVHFVVPRLMPEPDGAGPRHRFVPAGLTYRAAADSAEVHPLPSRPSQVVSPGDEQHPDPWYRKLAADAWFMEGEDLRRRGRLEAADSAYVRAARIVPESRTTNFNVALMLMRMGRLESAVRYALKAVAADPVRRGAYRLAEHLLRQQGRIEAAERVHKQALEWARIP